MRKIAILCVLCISTSVLAEIRFMKTTGDDRAWSHFNGTNLVEGLIQNELSRLNDKQGESSVDRDSQRVICEQMLQVADKEWLLIQREQRRLRREWERNKSLGLGVESVEFRERLQDPSALWVNRYRGKTPMETPSLCKEVNDQIVQLVTEIRTELLDKKEDSDPAKKQALALIAQEDSLMKEIDSKLQIDGRSLTQIFGTNAIFALSVRYGELGINDIRKLDEAGRHLTRDDADVLGKTELIEASLESIFGDWIMEDLPCYEERLLILHDAYMKWTELYAFQTMLFYENRLFCEGWFLGTQYGYPVEKGSVPYSR